MSKYKLTYFDFDGGRGEPIRIALHAAGIEFEDHRISFAEFGEMRQNFRFNAVPILMIDDTEITQSNAIGRYVGKMAGLYPKDDRQALYCDEVTGALEDLTYAIVQTFGLQDDELKKAREKLVGGRMTVFLRGLGDMLNRGGGEYFADQQMTIADLRAFVQVRSLRSGKLDHVPPEIVQELAPNLVEHQQRIENDPRVVAYYASRSSA